MLQAPNLEKFPHGFFGRQGGVSVGPFESLNFSLSRGDTLKNIIQNHQVVIKALNIPPRPILIADQVHGAQVHVVKTPWLLGQNQAPQADGLITMERDGLLGVITADCVPILLADPHRNVIATIHAGWRSAAQGIVGQTITQMQRHRCYPINIRAAIGPCIRQPSFEVGPEVHNTFIATDSSLEDFFISHTGKYLCDLPGIVQHQLQQAGVTNIYDTGIDTYTHPDTYFSARRSFHENITFGCQVAVIGLD